MSYRNNYTQVFNQTKTAYPTIRWQTALGHNPELSSIRKFGRNQDVASGGWEDVWDYGGDFNWPSNSGVAMYISSDNAADTQDIIVEGLDEFFRLKSETVTLQGVTFVALTGLWSRVHRAYNDNGTDLAGTVYISSDNTDAGGDGIPDVTTAIHATIPVGENQTLQALYTVPAATEMYVTNVRVNLLPVAGGTVKQCRVKIDLRLFEKVWRTQATFGLITTGTSFISQDVSIPVGLPAKTDVRVRAFGIGAAVEVDAAFTGVLISI
jgi:hypothetical protein